MADQKVERNLPRYSVIETGRTWVGRNLTRESLTSRNTSRKLLPTRFYNIIGFGRILFQTSPTKIFHPNSFTNEAPTSVHKHQLPSMSTNFRV